MIIAERIRMGQPVSHSDLAVKPKVPAGHHLVAVTVYGNREFAMDVTSKEDFANFSIACTTNEHLKRYTLYLVTDQEFKNSKEI